MSEWSLPVLLAGLHKDIEQQLSLAREALAHPGTKGDASEKVWIELFRRYLPERYRAEKAHVVDSNGLFSQQIDVVIFDRQYTPLVFELHEQLIVPAESIYAVFEAKQTLTAAHIGYAKEKAASVRKLHRTSLPIPYAGGTYASKPLTGILAGILTFESTWSPPLGDTLIASLKSGTAEEALDIGCVAAHGMFTCDDQGCHSISPQGKPATAFLLELIARLQSLGTVAMIDTRAYARWLS